MSGISAALGLGLVMLVVGCQESRDSVASDAGPENRLAVHVASIEPDDHLSVQKMGPEGEVFLTPLPLITEDDLLRASPGTAADGGPALVLELTDDAAARLLAESDAYVGRHLAFLWDGRVVFAPRVHSALSKKLMIVGSSDALPPEELHEIAERINVPASERQEGK